MKLNINNHYFGVAYLLIALSIEHSMASSPFGKHSHKTALLIFLIATFILIFRFIEGLVPSRKQKGTMWLPLYLIAGLFIVVIVGTFAGSLAAG